MFTHPTCGGQHARAATARRCDAGETFPCHWLTLAFPAYDPAAAATDPYYDEAYAEACDEGPREVECGATAWDTGTGWACEAGHSHVNADVRYAEGWDYAHPDEAAAMTKYGVLPVAMDGSGVIPV